MTESMLWWMVAGFFLSLEVLSRSYHLLMLALGAAAAGFLAMLGAHQTVQMLVAAVVGGCAVYAWHFKLLKRGALALDDYIASGLGEQDVGEPVMVSMWHPDGTAKVHYRGSDWMARFHGAHVPTVGEHRILAVEPDCLVLENH